MVPLNNYSFRNPSSKEAEIAYSIVHDSLYKELKTFRILGFISFLFVVILNPLFSLSDLERMKLFSIFFLLFCLVFGYFFSVVSNRKRRIKKMRSFPIRVLDCIIEKTESNRFYGEDGVDVEIAFLKDLSGKKVIFDLQNKYHEQVDYIPMERFFMDLPNQYKEGERALLVYIENGIHSNTFVITKFMLHQ